jgi:hypothetical protein
MSARYNLRAKRDSRNNSSVVEALNEQRPNPKRRRDNLPFSHHFVQITVQNRTQIASRMFDAPQPDAHESDGRTDQNDLAASKDQCYANTVDIAMAYLQTDIAKIGPRDLIVWRKYDCVSSVAEYWRQFRKCYGLDYPRVESETYGKPAAEEPFQACPSPPNPPNSPLNSDAFRLALGATSTCHLQYSDRSSAWCRWYACSPCRWIRRRKRHRRPRERAKSF